MPERISASKTKTFGMCQRQYDYKYNLGNYSPPSQPAMQGIISHEIVAIDMEHKLATGKNMDLQEKLDLVDVKFKESFENGNTEFQDSLEDLVRETRELIQVHHDNFAIKVDPFLIEKKFEVDVYGQKVNGVIDLITKDSWIIDHKFLTKSPSQSEVDRDIQLSFYSLAFRLMFGEVEKGIRLDCTIKTKNKKALTITTSRSNQELEWTAKFIIQVSKAMDSGNYPPNSNGWWCSDKWCPAYDACMNGEY